MYGAAMADITDIFISHSSDDSEIAKRVFEVLQEGRRVFLLLTFPLEPIGTSLYSENCARPVAL